MAELNAQIPLSGINPRFQTPEQGIQLDQMALQLGQQQQQLGRQNQVRQLMSDPNMFDENGAPSPESIGRVMAIDPTLGTQFMHARSMTLQQVGLNQRAQLVHDAQIAAAQAKQKAAEAHALSGMTKDQRTKYDLSVKIGHDIDVDALASYDAAVKTNDPDAVGKWRAARLARIDELEKSGTLAAAGWSPETIQMARDKMAVEGDPEVARERVKSTRMRQIETKAAADSPYKTGLLAVANRRADQGDSRISLQEIGQQLKSDTLDAKIEADERKAGIAEDVIAARREHSKAVLDLRAAKQEAAKDTADTTAEERERHNRAVEEARTKEGDLRAKAYGDRAEKTSQLTGKPGGERAQGTTLIKADKVKESQIAQLNRELESGAITQDQHDSMIAKLTAQGKAGAGGLNVTVGADKAMAARGFMADPENPGQLTYVPGGPADPAVISRNAKAKSAGSSKTFSQNSTLGGEDYAGPAQHGEDYLKQFKPEFADTVRKVAKGSVPIELISKSRSQQQKVLEAVLQYDPEWVYKPKASANAAVAGGGLSKGAIDVLAEQILAGDNRARIGLSKSNSLAPVLNRAAELAKARGWSGKDIAAMTADYEGARSGARTAGVKGANTEMAVAEAQNIAPLVLEASRAVNRTNYPSLNKIILYGKAKTGDPEVVKFGIAVNSMINVYARAISPTGVGTVSDKEHARELLETSWSKGQIEAAIAQLNQEMEAARKSPGQVRKSIRESVTDPEGSSGTPAPKKGAPPPPASGTSPGAAAGPRRETPGSKMPPAPYADADKERRYQEWKRQHAQ